MSKAEQMAAVTAKLLSEEERIELVEEILDTVSDDVRREFLEPAVLAQRVVDGTISMSEAAAALQGNTEEDECAACGMCDAEDDDIPVTDEQYASFNAMDAALRTMHKCIEGIRAADPTDPALPEMEADFIERVRQRDELAAQIAGQ